MAEPFHARPFLNAAARGARSLGREMVACATFDRRTDGEGVDERYAPATAARPAVHMPR